jgi:hypothetical protein
MPMDMHIIFRLSNAFIAALLSPFFFDDNRGRGTCQGFRGNLPIQSLGNYPTGSNPPSRYQASSRSAAAP